MRSSLVQRVSKRDANRVAYRPGAYVFLPINATEKSLWWSSNIIVKREQEDPSIFAKRFSRSYRLLRLIACRVLGDEERVPLAIKNCWRSASRNPPYFEYEGAFRSWLVRVLIDEALVIRRKFPEPAYASEVLCAFGSSLYKTFRRHGLHLRDGLSHPGGVNALEGTVHRGRTHALCIEAQGRREHGLLVPRVRHLPRHRL